MPSALCGQLSTIFPPPIIRDVLPMRWKTVLIRRAVNVDLRRDVQDDGLSLADAFPAVIDPVGHLYQQGVVNPDKKFVNLSFGPGTLSRIIKDQLDHALDGADVIGLDFMVVPGLHHLRIGGGEIHLTELKIQVVIGPENLHDSSPLIRNHL